MESSGPRDADAYDDHNDSRLDDVLIKWIEAGKVHDVGDHLVDDHSDHGLEDIALPAEQPDTTNDDCSDRIKFPAGAYMWNARRGARHKCKSGQSRQHTRQDVDCDLMTTDRYPCEARRPFVPTDSVQVSPKARARQNPGKREHQERPDDDWRTEYPDRKFC